MKTETESKISNRQKIFIGGLGGITPILMNLLVIDLKLLLLDLTAIAIIGYLIRVIILFYLGGIVAFLNRGESDPIRIFQLGIAAPALITAFINGNNIDISKTAASQERPAHSYNIYQEKPAFQFAMNAYAQPAGEDNLKTFSPPPESGIQQFLRGLVGSTPKNIWFVIAGSHLNQEAALQHKKNLIAKGFNAEIYKPFGDNPYFAVVIGSHLTYTEAIALRQKAIDADLSKDTFVWTFPSFNRQ